MGLFSYVGRLDRRAGIMGDMAERVGVDWSEVIATNPEKVKDYRNAVMTCAQCEREGDCLRWQAGHVHAEHAPGFCLNRDMLDGLKAR